MVHTLLGARGEHPVAQLLGFGVGDGRSVSAARFFHEINITQQKQEAGVPQCEHGKPLHGIWSERLGRLQKPCGECLLVFVDVLVAHGVEWGASSMADLADEALQYGAAREC